MIEQTNLGAYSTVPATIEPFRICLSCYCALQANDDPRAGEVLSAAYRPLNGWAARIDDEDGGAPF